VRRILAIAILIGLARALPAAEPEVQKRIDEELRFASGLVQWGFPDYAQKYLDTKVLPKYPEAKAQASSVRIEILTARGKFDEAEALIKTLPPGTLETLIMQLTLADRYYAGGRMDKARPIYEGFFKLYTNGPPPELKRFYGESAYKYSQMLLFTGDKPGAYQAYKYVLLSKPEEEIERAVQCEMAELAFKLGEAASGPERQRYFKECKELCTTIQWKDRGIWFGKTVVILSHIELINGKPVEARKVIGSYMDMLTQIDEELRKAGESLKHSPMAECLYLLGTLLEKDGLALLPQPGKDAEAKKMLGQALTHYQTVFVTYAESAWAPDAGRRLESLSDQLIAMGMKVIRKKVDLRPVVEAQFKDAKLLFAQQDYKTAADRYVTALNIFPSYPGSVTALGELARCYLNLNDEYYSKAVTAYIAERFAKSAELTEEAGNALLAIAAEYESSGRAERAAQVHEMFFRFYPTHPRAAATIFRFGEAQLRLESYGNALPYYRRVVEEYSKERVYVDALNRLAFCHIKMGEFTNATPYLAKYIEELSPSADQIQARLGLAGAYRQADQLVAAINEFARIITLLTEEPTKFGATPDDTARNLKALEDAVFFKANSYARLKKPEDKIPLYQTKAIEGYQEFLTRFAKSERAPFVLGSLGTLLFIQGRADEAQKAFQRIEKEYPESEEAKNIIYVQGKALLELGRTDEAVKVFQRMFDNPGKFSPAQFLQAATAMHEAGQLEPAARAYEEARKAPERGTWETATMGMGKAAMQKGDFGAAAQAIAELLAKYPNSGYTVEANFILCRVYAELWKVEKSDVKRADLYKKAVEAMNTIKRFARDPDIRVRADLELMRMQVLTGRNREAVASCSRVLLLADTGNPKVRPWYEEAFAEGLPLILKAEDFENALEFCEKYLAEFPQGKYVKEARKWRDEAKLKVVTPLKPAVTPAAPAAPAVPDAAAPAPK
jgi:tetratricopeptide (TPR) repeat protein